jgi:hypothetical protein
MSSMHGLTVRWSLVEAADGTEDELAEYVAGTSHARFSGMPGLRFKTWRMRRGEWFEGCYVFETPEARQSFEDEFRAGAVDAPGSQIIGSPPAFIEPCDIVSVAEGGSGFVAPAAYR